MLLRFKILFLTDFPNLQRIRSKWKKCARMKGMEAFILSIKRDITEQIHVRIDPTERDLR